MESIVPKPDSGEKNRDRYLLGIGFISMAVGIFSFVIDGFPKGTAACIFYTNGMILLLAFRSKRDLRNLESQLKPRGVQ